MRIKRPATKKVTVFQESPPKACEVGSRWKIRQNEAGRKTESYASKVECPCGTMFLNFRRKFGSRLPGE